MPKMKTKSASKKRFSKTGNGLIKGAKAFRRHLLTKKTRKSKRAMRKGFYAQGADRANIARSMPY
jgi:large subunit ribosomal protein L35